MRHGSYVGGAAEVRHKISQGTAQHSNVCSCEARRPTLYYSASLVRYKIFTALDDYPYASLFDDVGGPENRRSTRSVGCMLLACAKLTSTPSLPQPHSSGAVGVPCMYLFHDQTTFCWSLVSLFIDYGTPTFAGRLWWCRAICYGPDLGLDFDRHNPSGRTNVCGRSSA